MIAVGELQHRRYSGRTLARGGWDAVDRGAAAAADIELVQWAMICIRVGAANYADARATGFDPAPNHRHEKLAAAKTQYNVALHARPPRNTKGEPLDVEGQETCICLRVKCTR
jgi:hypothetical protein